MLRVTGRLACLTGFLPPSFLACPLWGSATLAADLQGDCCADLEARVADLEAMTVGKGNRRVCVTLSGHVAKQVMSLDDGVDAGTYIADIDPTQSTNFRLRRPRSRPAGPRATCSAPRNLTQNHTSLNQFKAVDNRNLDTQMTTWSVAWLGGLITTRELGGENV